MRTLKSQKEIDEVCSEAEVIAIDIMRLIGLTLDPDGRSFSGVMSIAGAGGALGLAAARVMSAASDESFEEWIHALRGERAKTRATRLTTQ
jgi:hypothetical protein